MRMWMQCAVLLFVALQLDIVVTLAIPDQPPAPSTVTANQRLPQAFIATNSATPTRRLRTYEVTEAKNTGDKSDEERVDTLTIAKLALKVKLKSAQDLARKLFLRSKPNWPDRVFFYFFSGKNGGQVDNNPKVAEWLRYTIDYNAKHGAGSFSNNDIYEMLAGSMSKEGMLKLFQSLGKTSDLQKLGSELGKLHYMKTTSPSDAFKALGLETAGVKISADNPKLLEWFHHTNVFQTGRISIYDDEIHTLLSSKMSEAELAAAYEMIKGIAGLGPLGQRLQNLQIRKWVLAWIRPGTIKKRLGTVMGADKILSEYRRVYKIYASARAS